MNETIWAYVVVSEITDSLLAISYGYTSKEEAQKALDSSYPQTDNYPSYRSLVFNCLPEGIFAK